MKCSEGVELTRDDKAALELKCEGYFFVFFVV